MNNEQIEFSGEISKECKTDIYKRKVRWLILYFTILCLILIIVSVIINAHLGTLTFSAYKNTLIASPILTALFISFYLTYPKSKSVLNNKWNYKIVIDSTEVICTQYFRSGQDFKTVKKAVSKIKKVIDSKEYFIIGNRFALKNSIFCQKDLITKGTLKEFEKIFDGKIKR